MKGGLVMSKLYEVMEAYSDVQSVCEVEMRCKKMIEETAKLLESSPEDGALKRMHEGAKSDLVTLEAFREELIAKFDDMYEKYLSDPEFVEEVEKTPVVPEEYKELLVALKAEVAARKGKELGAE
jgi:SPX domain protein involved in polyphosphate accumulation